MKASRLVTASFFLGAALANAQEWSTVWQLGAPLRGWPLDGVGGGPEADFVQEANVNDPPGDPNSPAVAQQADDDYYFAGSYPAPIGSVSLDEIAMERAFAGADNNLRVHFNLDSGTYGPNDYFRFSLEPFNLHQDVGIPDPRYGVSVFFNGTPILPEVVVRPGQINTIITSDEFTFADVGAIFGPGGDNVVLIQGTNYNAEGGGNWMGMDYHHLESRPIPEPTSSTFALLGGLAGALCLVGRRGRRAS